MFPDLDVEGGSEIVVEASACKENGSVVKELEDNHMRCASNCEDNTFEMEAVMDEQTLGAGRSEDVEVNITECTTSGGIGLVEDECQDATGNSSSFGGSVSGIENGAMLNDDEVNSELCGDPMSALASDPYGEVFRMRKKKPTSHWRTFIRPLMWRCRWVELQIKKFQLQANKYDRELAEYNKGKQLELENITLEGFDAKSLPFSCQSHRRKAMKRKKRKRVEDAMDIAPYMLHHNLFSYYENKRSSVDGASMDDDWGNLVTSTDKTINGTNEFGVNDELLLLEFKDGDNSMEEILWKIGNVQSQVSKMKTRLGKLMSENAGRFSSTDKLSLLVPCNAPTSSAQNPGSPSYNGDRMPLGPSYIASQLISEYNMGDLVKPESAVSSHGEVTHLPDIIESIDQPQVGGSCTNTGDGILIYNQRAKEELNDFEDVKIWPIEKPQVPKKEKESTNPAIPVLESDLFLDDQPTPKIRSISKLTAPKNTRKRGRRKAGSSRWSRRSS
ncbi:hypothetical protein F0562_014707 [Nyssa sinensis]|uniref:Uncharacterized protein n=1 Tax=Nyssa sinensis TaxID=561372 RepID=A0A5J4ZTL8_9ASTE|nr:hypothetical protein F0562_014707 [Nyssa sinensis]